MKEIEDLQIRISFQEDLIQELNRTVARQQTEIEALRRGLQLFQQRLQEVERSQSDGKDGESTDFELPPHY